MKLLPTLFCAALFGGATLAAAPAAQAQINVNINTAPPVVVGAPADAQYYYVPEINGYYDVPARRYLVQRNGKWTRLERIDGYDPRNFHPQYIEYRGAEPWTYRGGNPHGLPPGQAKKMYRDDRDHDGGRRDNDDRDDHGKGHGKGKKH
ncbi:hypothetical protein [Hymenobacter convexus]|uniref:hypothetical protein n=1 Tax=Hymenobacter sp. CA1UV-4 TaxID=3063782 RepID=UPI002712FE91|nr:hypothetical protein [Hymenobacter sp. CA1UV-4]MDO7850303.1 hypothetical protein [Hymenobacter sp. CA1UV-4]